VPLVSSTGSEAEEYAALSYFWGDESVKKPIIVNGAITEITANLEALRHLAQEDRSVAIWADALCICVVRRQDSCRRFWRHLPPETAVFIASFLSESVKLCSRSHHVQYSILVSDFLSRPSIALVLRKGVAFFLNRWSHDLMEGGVGLIIQESKIIVKLHVMDPEEESVTSILRVGT
jgi:hypothetical protein